MDQFERLDPKAKGCMRVAALFGMTTWVIISMIVFFLTKGLLRDAAKVVLLLLVVSYILCALNAIISPGIRYLRYRYCINEEKIHVIEGLFYITESIAPIERVHQIEVCQDPIDRMFGLGKVNVTTAGGEITLRFLKKEQADEMAKNLQAKIREIVHRQWAERGME